MGISERKIRQQDEIRNNIIEQSWTIVRNEGWQALSIRRIAEAIEYSVPVIYKHFENKEAIQEHFIREGFAALTEHLDLAQQVSTDPSEKIRDIANSYWKFAAQQTDYYRIMFGLGIPTCEKLNSVMEMHEVSEIMSNAILDTAKTSGIKNIDIHLKIKSFWSTLHGFIAIELLSNSTIPEKSSPIFNDAIESYIYTLTNKK
ncbi:TetR/AcrR family transcriptional regulator [Sphingobacterium shayense]|uniref:TetR/AcrR family transcriptional regulator n=1 Tax=Sphingobacterium shayense TaxID=626343 RepID=UPI0015579995|nr:TetR/AcrR family transcriptional regulator [Sphingobacterium shayense]NQD69846.1 TetR/AcrR family transcriptional regulator [Sphingobacterium shayense]